jgi:transcriptional regulator with XRE-family HTH domain
MIAATRFSVVVGAVLRDHRLACGYTLHEVAAKSRGLMKPSALASYERAERKITLERFVKVMSLYNVPADRALSEVLARISPRIRRKFTLDVDKLRTLGGQTRELLDFIHRVRVARGDYLTRMISLRSGDLEAVSSESRASQIELLSTMSGALVSDRGPELAYRRGSSNNGSGRVSLPADLLPK